MARNQDDQNVNLECNSTHSTAHAFKVIDKELRKMRALIRDL